MRIVHLIPNLNFGGLQEVVRGLALGQRALGHDVSILCWEHPSNHPEVEQELALAGVAVEPARAYRGRALASIWALRGRLARERVDVLHLHNPFEYCLYGAVAARLSRRAKVVTTIHATAMFDRFSRQQRAIFWVSVLLTRRVVGVCEEARDVVGRRFHISSRKLAVVENGIDVARYLSIPPRPWREPGAEVVFGAVGRISRIKNQAMLVEAFALARDQHPNIRLRLLGGAAAEIPELEALASALGVEDRLELQEFSHDVAAFLRGLDVFVLPSRSEGLPLSLLEAIAAGLPVVATDVGGVRKVVETTQGGRVCAPDDARALMEAMSATLRDADRTDGAARARRIVAERYSVARMTDDYELVYASQ